MHVDLQRATLKGTYVFMLQMLEQLELTVCALSENGSAEGLHDFLDCDILVRELIAGGTVCWTLVSHKWISNVMVARGRVRPTYQTRPNAPMPTGWRSEYL